MTHDETSAREHWQNQYAGDAPRWSGRVNPTLAAAVESLEASPGTAMDLGCGEGGDAIWLATRGWQVTGIDISETALSCARKAARSAGVEDRTTWQVVDLTRWVADRQVDLVCSSFMHSPVAFDRVEVLRRAARAVAPGGHLVVVTHFFASAEDLAPWMRQDPDRVAHLLAMPSPAEEFETLALGQGWQMVAARTCSREATGPDGSAQATLTDGLLVIRRS